MVFLLSVEDYMVYNFLMARNLVSGFYLVYTDEGVNDPLVYEVNYEEEYIAMAEMDFIRPWDNRMIG